MEKNQTRVVKGALVIAFAFIALLSLTYPKLTAAFETKDYPVGDKAKFYLDDPDAKRSSAAGSKGKTPFGHERHAFPSKYGDKYKDSCVICHHTNTKNLTKAMEEAVRRCDECHKADDSTCELEGTYEDNKFKGKNAINAKDAYHGTGDASKIGTKLAGCITCHKDERNIFPQGCTECHDENLAP